MEIGKKIRYLRKEKGIYQYQLAKASNVSELTIIRIENNQVQPNPATLICIADALGVPVKELKDK